ncbi:HupE/UreJ family protein [Sphaerotilaceae bacterium SBD11-9]
MKRALVVLATLLWPLLSFAHKPSDAYLQLQVDGTQVTQRFDVALRDLERELALDANDDGQLDWREVRTRWSDIAQLADSGLALQADGQPCQAGPLAAPQLDEHSDGPYAVLARRWTCAAEVQQLDLTYTLFAQTDPTHRGIVRVQRGEHSETAVLVPTPAAHRFELATTSGFASFVREGVHHILIGTDHILFLLALLLPAVLVRTPGTGWRAATQLRPVLAEVLRVVTAFTVAHSITLALAAFDWVNPPSRWVESTIAASVVLAALNNLWPVIGEGRWKLTFAFGLVHGFGFAGALKDLGLSQGGLAGPMFGFNLGVELGQLAIVAAFLAIVWAVRDTRLYRSAGLRAGSAAIAVLAFAWLLERALDLSPPWAG